MKRDRQFLLSIALIIALTTMAEEPRFYAGYLFSESKWEDFGKTRCGLSLVKLDSVTSCYAKYYKGNAMPRPIYKQQIKEIENVIQLDSSEAGCSCAGRATDGTYFVEKQFYNRPVDEGIIFYQISNEYYEEVIERLRKYSYLPLDLFRDSLLRLMDYKLIGASLLRYEEGCNGFAFVKLDSAKYCFVHYFEGAMMGTPLYLNQIKDIEYVTRSDSSQHENKYSSKTGLMDYGKASDGTYFVEKLFYDNNRLPQGIIIFQIPKEYYEEVLMSLCSLSCLPPDLFDTTR